MAVVDVVVCWAMLARLDVLRGREEEVLQSVLSIFTSSDRFVLWIRGSGNENMEADLIYPYHLANMNSCPLRPYPSYV